AGHRNQMLEDFAFVYQICQTPRSGFFAKLRSGALALLPVKLFDAIADLSQRTRVEKSFDDYVSGRVQLRALHRRHRIYILFTSSQLVVRLRNRKTEAWAKLCGRRLFCSACFPYRLPSRALRVCSNDSIWSPYLLTKL